jgi:hypothetical protein
LGYISTIKKKKGTTIQPHFSLVSMIPYPVGITRGNKKRKIGVGLGKAQLTMGRGQPFAGATYCTVLHCCIKEQKTQIKTRGKQQAQKASLLLLFLLLISIHLI